ncbi:hypothetical protein FB45DRAFT_1036835 [Roridomyces roridus]|uniref:Uncharacterized protein n=1 Tax=Roridomyces roridus TaxID=1738132 RepID=A0AAD7FCR3_9AGAR|nr:hypothetical protein FB45DRAFT_1036835 [Roridomyces roridus]
MTCKVATKKKDLKNVAERITAASFVKGLIGKFLVFHLLFLDDNSSRPVHKHTCGDAPDKDITIRLGRNIHHHQFFRLHLLLYTLRALGPPRLPSEKHEFMLMVVVDLVPLSPPLNDAFNKTKRIAVGNNLPVPLCIIPPEMVEIHRGVVQATRPEVRLHCIWITTSDVYAPGTEDNSRNGALAVTPFMLNNYLLPGFSLDLYSYGYGVHRRVTQDLDFLFESINDELRLDTENHYLLRA